jgi:sugar/nucleoside kinase (ribokinase family)
MDVTQVESLIMKLGSKGFIAYQGMDEKTRKSQSFPALSINPIDVSGAGDSLLAVMAIGMSNKQDFFTTAALASCVSCLAVENLGNKPISRDSLIDFIQNIL